MAYFQASPQYGIAMCCYKLTLVVSYPFFGLSPNSISLKRATDNSANMLTAALEVNSLLKRLS